MGVPVYCLAKICRQLQKNEENWTEGGVKNLSMQFRHRVGRNYNHLFSQKFWKKSMWLSIEPLTGYECLYLQSFFPSQQQGVQELGDVFPRRGRHGHFFANPHNQQNKVRFLK